MSTRAGSGTGAPHAWAFPPPLAGTDRQIDVLKWPVVGRFLRWRRSRTVMQAVLLLFAIVLVAHGLFGPQLAPRNLATIVTWVHIRGLLVLGLLVAGNLFCMACPFMLVRDAARRFAAPVRTWPRRLRNKWVSVAGLVLLLFVYEVFDLWGSPWWTAWLIVGYFGAAVVVDTVYRHAPFCKYLCPLGQFNFVASTVSPLEVRIARPATCVACTTLDCIRGARDPASGQVVQRGCELALFQPLKHGNLDCTFCLDCIHACPHDNVAIATRLPGAELWTDPPRSGVGRLSRRGDMGALVLVFTFGALLNAFAMVSPVHAVQSSIGALLGTATPALVMGTLFTLALVVEPVLLLGFAAWATRRGTGDSRSLPVLATRFAFALVPFGLGVWSAHYAFHFLTGLWTVIPVLQDTLAGVGLPLLGEPDWRLGGLPPSHVLPLETGFIGLGLAGSLLVAWHIAVREFGARAGRAFAPWAVLAVLLWGAAMWLMAQPMEMRGTVLGG